MSEEPKRLTLRILIVEDDPMMRIGLKHSLSSQPQLENDVGLITLPNGQHLAVAVFVSDSTAVDATREEVIARVVRATWDKWSK